MRFVLSRIPSFFWTPFAYRTIDDWEWYSLMFLCFNIDIRLKRIQPTLPNTTIIPNWDGSLTLIGIGIPQSRFRGEIQLPEGYEQPTSR